MKNPILHRPLAKHPLQFANVTKRIGHLRTGTTTSRPFGADRLPYWYRCHHQNIRWGSNRTCETIETEFASSKLSRTIAEFLFRRPATPRAGHNFHRFLLRVCPKHSPIHTGYFKYGTVAGDSERIPRI